MRHSLGKIFIAVGSFLVLAAAGVLIALYAYSGNPSDTNPVSLTGAWKGELNESSFVATITDNQIEIQWKTDPDTIGLYWKGTFATPVNAHAGDMFTVTSAGDVEAMSNSLLGSTHTSKVFTYDHRELTFEFTIMKVNTTVHLQRQNNA